MKFIFCPWPLAPFSQLSSIKQLLAQCSQPGKPSLWLLSNTGSSYPKLWFYSVCLFQVVSSPFFLSCCLYSSPQSSPILVALGFSLSPHLIFLYQYIFHIPQFWKKTPASLQIDLVHVQNSEDSRTCIYVA